MIHDFAGLLSDHATSLLTRIEQRQLSNAVENPRHGFHERIVLPQAYRPDHPEHIYLGIALDEDVKGRNHRMAAELAGQPDAWNAVTYFTNPLIISEPSLDPITGDEVWVAPMKRVAFGLSQVFTFEFDQPDIAFFKRQLAWCRASTGRAHDTAMGKLFRECSRWIDFEGITVAWSGNKSFHIHIAFSTAQAKAIGISENIRDKLKAHWKRLLETVLGALEPGAMPDMGMDQPERFRRIPNGSRVLSKTNILGMPAGTIVPQVTVWEKYRDRAPKGAATSFFDPMLFTQAFAAPSRFSKQLTFMPTGPELEFCETKMKATFSDYPEFAGFTTHKGELRAQFFNGPGDKRPSSYMELDYRTVNINGGHTYLTPSTATKLPKPLGEMMVEWVGEYDAFNSRPRTATEKAFANAVTDSSTAKRAICDVLLTTIRENENSFVCAPEGISKTSSLFENHHRIDRWLEASGESRAMYAFADYASAAEKAAEFNKAQRHNGFVAVVLESFDRAYRGACTVLGIKPLTLADAASGGFLTLWQAIEKLQPKVMERFCDLHFDLWQKQIGDAKPVFFTVHSVAHRWSYTSPTRLMWAPSYWLPHANQTERNKACRAELSIGLLVHDEVKAESLVAAYRAELIQWVDEMVRDDPEAWGSNSYVALRMDHYARYLARAGAPLVNGSPTPISFETVQDIHAFHGHEWAQVHTQDSGEYGQLSGPIYADRLGHEWCLRERTWPRDTARRTVVLTTETVPLTIARMMCETEWTIFDLDTPHIKRDAVSTHPVRGIRGDRLAVECQGWREAHPNIFVVSNRVAHLTDTMTHAGARGSNALMGKDVLQTMTFLTPDEFEYLEALNAWTGSDTLIRHRHIDEFNQTAGRNLGFRKRGSPKHILLVNKRLFELLTGEPRARVRYEMNIMVNRYQRTKAITRQRYQNDGAGDVARIKMVKLRALLLKQSRPGLRRPMRFDQHEEYSHCAPRHSAAHRANKRR